MARYFFPSLPVIPLESTIARDVIIEIGVRDYNMQVATHSVRLAGGNPVVFITVHVIFYVINS